MPTRALNADSYASKTRDLCRTLGHLFPCASVDSITDSAKLKDLEPKGMSRQFAVVQDRDIYLLVYPGRPRARACAALRVRCEIRPSTEDHRFACIFSKVFNEDLSDCGNELTRSDRIWRELEVSQSVRAIAEFVSPQPVGRFQGWLRAAESAMNLTYEGERAHPCIVFYRKQAWANSNLHQNYVSFKTPVAVDHCSKISGFGE